MERFFNEIKKNDNYKKNETLVILSSDHWAKEGYGDFITRSFDDGKVPYPSLFLAKIIGDDEPFDIYEPDSGIHVQELIHEFLRKKISSHADINKFFSEKRVIVFMWTQKFNSLKRMTFDESDLF